MTTLVCDFIDIIGEPIDGVASLSTGEVRPDYSHRSVKVPHPVSETVVAGQATFSNVRPGKAVLTVHWEGRSATFRFTVPDTESITLIDAVAGEGLEQSELDEFRAGIAAEFRNTRNAVIDAATDAEAAAASAADSADAAASSATAANNSRGSAASSATAAAQSAVDAANSERVAGERKGAAEAASAAAASSASEAAASAGAAASSESAAATSAGEADASAGAASDAADRAENVVDTVQWQGDQLSVMGKVSPPLTGDDGETPYIGVNGTWWVGDTDTGVRAQGEKGDPGDGSGDVLWSELNPVLDGKAPATHTHTIGQVTGLRSELDGKAAADHPHDWDDVAGKPTVYPPETHTHTAAQISDATTVGRNVLKASSAANARSAIGAGTSNLALGTTASTAAAGDHTHTPASIGAAPASHTHSQYATTTTVNGVSSRVTTLENAQPIIVSSLPSSPLPGRIYLVTG